MLLLKVLVLCSVFADAVCVCVFITCAVALLPDAVNHVLQIADAARNVTA